MFKKYVVCKHTGKLDSDCIIQIKAIKNII